MSRNKAIHMVSSPPPPPSSVLHEPQHRDGFVVRPPPLPPTAVGHQVILQHDAPGGGGTTADRKLLHLVRKVLASSSTPGPSSTNISSGSNNNTKKTNLMMMSADAIVTILRQQHREYQRKDAALLRRQVETALQQIAAIATTPASAAATTASPGTKQRSVARRKSKSTTATTMNNEGGNDDVDDTIVDCHNKDDSNDDQDQDYDLAAAQHDALRQALQASSRDGAVGGGGLNASLRNKYRQIQQSRDAQLAAEAAAAVLSQQDQAEQSAEQSGSNTNGNDNGDCEHDKDPNNGDNMVENDEPEKVVATAVATSATADTTDVDASTVAVAAATEGKGKKRKKPSKSSSGSGTARRRMSTAGASSSGSAHLLGGGDGGGGSTDFMTPVDPSPTERYSDLGGLQDVIQEIRQLVEYPLLRPELYRHLGVVPPRGVLLRGPPGVGKTHLANAVAGELSLDNNGGVAYFRVAAPELVSSMSGDSEGRIRSLFQAASDLAPSLIFMDELDAIAPKRSDNAGGGRGMEKRMVAQLLTCMDMVAPVNNRNQAAVLVLGATNRPDALDPALRRAGRFDKEILLSVPDEAARMGILRTMTQGMRLMTTPTSPTESETAITTLSLTTTTTTTSSNPIGFDFKILARKTPGFVGADLQSLTKEAAVVAINRIFRDVLDGDSQNDTTTTTTTSALPTIQDKAAAPDTSNTTLAIRKTTTRAPIIPLTAKQMDPLYVTMQDFLTAIPLVQPSSKREGFATVPDVSWDDIGALKSIREELTISVLEPIRHPEKFQMLGLPIPAGCLLYGPPGCGKTLLAKAIAHESGANFISIKGPELLDKYVGESERAVRLVFERARSSCPCIVFFDELDSLVPRRGGSGGESGGGVSERIVNQLLTEMDGVTARKSVFCIAATNRPELIDPAMMRPGRLDKLLYVPLPTPEDRVAILKAQSKNMKLDRDVDLYVIGTSPRANGYSGADCTALLREAGLAVLKEDAVATPPMAAEDLRIQARHFELAFANVAPSVSKKDQARYDRIRNRMARARSRSIDATDAAAADDDMIAPPLDSSMLVDDAANVDFPGSNKTLRLS